MKNNFFSLMMFAVLVMTACAPSSSPTLAPPTETTIPSTPTPKGRTLIVTSSADSGPGTRRAFSRAVAAVLAGRRSGSKARNPAGLRTPTQGTPARRPGRARVFQPGPSKRPRLSAAPRKPRCNTML